MADGNSGILLRPAEMLAKPVTVDPAFADPDAVVDLCRASAPYRLASAVHKMAPTGKDLPWYRIFWAVQGKLLDERAHEMFYNDTFIEAAKESFDAEVIVPVSLMNNVNAPMKAGDPHLDLAKFRGGDKLPFDLLVAMAYSNLFHDWAVPQASGLVWFYNGKGGDFDHWPDGPDGGVQTVRAPQWNAGCVSDNEYMWHRIGAIGPTKDHLAAGRIQRDSLLHADETGGGWTLETADEKLAFAKDEIRISILWKAYAFKNDAEYKRFLNKEHDLTIPQIVTMLNEDLKRRDMKLLDAECDFTRNEDLLYVRKAYRAPKLSDDVRPVID